MESASERLEGVVGRLVGRAAVGPMDLSSV